MYLTSLLEVSVLDHDMFGRASDDLIGTTRIDLEDRVFSPTWQGMQVAPTPVEWRPLYAPLSKHPQGQLEMWVDVLTPEQAAASPMFDIAPPPEQQWELRLIVWKAADMPDDADLSELCDAYVTAKLNDGKPMSTDTHFRAQKGKASWNYRLKFPLTMDSFLRDQRVQLQLWDKDVGLNDMLGGATLSLDKWLRRVYRRKRFAPTYWPVEEGELVEMIVYKDRLPQLMYKEDFSVENLAEKVSEFAETLLEKDALIAGPPDPDLEAAKFWLTLRDSDGEARGRLLLSMELVPAELLETRAAGHGRAEPNAHPFLPKPTGRIKFSLNPFRMCYRLLGPKLCKRMGGMCCCALCIVFTVLFVYYVLPVIVGTSIANLFTG